MTSVSNANSQAFATANNAISSAISDAVAKVSLVLLGILLKMLYCDVLRARY